MERRAGLSALAMIALPTAALAAPVSSPATQNAITRVTQCSNIASEKDRLTCFDRAAAALNAAVAQRDITILDKEDVRKARRTMFGFLLPNLEAFGIGDKAGSGESSEHQTLDTTIAAVRSVSYGKWDIVTAEQAVWRNVDLLDTAPAAGENVHINKGALGSFFLKTGSGRAVKALRIR